MPQIILYIDTVNNVLLKALNQSTQVDPASLPLYFGDTVSFRVYLLTPLQTQDPQFFNYSIISTAGLALELFLDDGTIGGTVYANQIVWTTDPANQYFEASLALNTSQLETLLGGNPSAQLWLKVGYTSGGLPTTVFSKQTNIDVGLPDVTLAVQPGQTPLSAEVANATYFPKQAVNGQPLFLASPNGKIIELIAIDNPDGSASLQANPIN